MTSCTSRMKMLRLSCADACVLILLQKKYASIDIRVARKDDDIIIRIRDDCIPFDPVSRHKLDTNADKTSSIGLRIVFGIPQHLQYQNTLGMNVITIRI